MGRSRDIATILSKTEVDNTSNLVLLNTTSTVSGVDSAEVQSIGLLSFSTLDSLPINNLEAGQQAYVTGTNRLYVSNGSGWFNVALINASPTLTIDPAGSISLATDGTPTTITLTATDSDTSSSAITFSVESDGSFSGLGSLSQDSSVFTITPKLEDSATTTSSTLTFKASDGINFGSGTTALSLTFSAATVDESMETLALVKADDVTETIVDKSTSPVTVSANGGIIPGSKSPYAPSGHSIRFNKSGPDRIDFGSLSDLKIVGTQDFTISAWIYVTDTNFSSDYLCFWDQGFSFQTYVQGGMMKTWISDDGSSYNVFSGGLRSNNNSIGSFTWYHVALMRSGNTWGWYVNGVWQDEGDQTASNGIYDNASQGTLIGNYYTGGYPFSGYIRDFKVDHAAIYTAGQNFTPPTSSPTAGANTKLLLTDTPYTRDESTYKRSVTIAGTIELAEFGPFDNEAYTKTDHIGSEEHDGTDGGGFGMPASAKFGYGTGDFSIEMWYYHKGLSQSSNGLYYSGLWDQRTSTQNYTSTAPMLFYDLNDNIEFWYSSGSKIDGPKLDTNQWSHIAVCRVSGDLKMYVNGRQVGSTVDASSVNFETPASAWGIGYSPGDQGGKYAYNGYIGECRVVKGASAYSAEFTPPTEPLTAISGTSFLVSGNRAKVWDAKAASNLNYAGNPTLNTSVRKWANGASIDFDRTDDTYSFYMRNGGVGKGGSDFTVEGWFYFDTANHQGLFQVSGTAGGLQSTNYAQTVAVGHNGSNWQLYGGGTTHTNGSAFTLSTGQWYHVAAVRFNGQSTLYIDGVENISFSDTYSYNIRHVVIGGYYSTSYLMDGKIQDFRITQGHARYTSSGFTPPSAEFEG